MAEGARHVAITAATPGPDGARHAVYLAWRAAPITNPKKFCITRSLDGDGNQIGWLIRQGGEKGDILHTYTRGDEQLADCILTWALLRANPPEGCIGKDELRILKTLGPEHGHRVLSDLDEAGIPVKPGVAGCLARGWVWCRPAAYSPTYAWYRLTEEGDRVAEKFFPKGFRTWL